MTSQGSAYGRFRRALARGNLQLVRAAAGELPTIRLDDALRVCLLIRDRDPDRYERAALRWTDVVTNIQDGHAPDAEYAAVSEYFQGKDLADLTFAIAQINAWNRLGIAFAVEWKPAVHTNSND